MPEALEKNSPIAKRKKAGSVLSDQTKKNEKNMNKTNCYLLTGLFLFLVL